MTIAGFLPAIVLFIYLNNLLTITRYCFRSVLIKWPVTKRVIKI